MTTQETRRLRATRVVGWLTAGVCVTIAGLSAAAKPPFPQNVKIVGTPLKGLDKNNQVVYTVTVQWDAANFDPKLYPVYEVKGCNTKPQAASGGTIAGSIFTIASAPPYQVRFNQCACAYPYDFTVRTVSGGTRSDFPPSPHMDPRGSKGYSDACTK